MKKVSIVIPCFNEEENVGPMSQAIAKIFAGELKAYDYELLFIDNDSKDRTREKLREICAENPHVKAIFNARNFGQFNSPYYALTQATGDCAVLMAADFQESPELIPQFVQGWEEGYRVVIAIKTKSMENKLMYFLRSCYYKTIKKLSDIEQIEHFTGFGLYDRMVLEDLTNLNDSTPFLRGIIAELGYKRKEIAYTQQNRRAGKTSNNFYKLFDAAMLSFTSYTKTGLRLATLLGMVCSCLTLVIGIIYLVMKLIFWDIFPAGMTPLLIVTCFLGSVQIFFIGLIGEYIMGVSDRVKHRPLVVEEERLNFTKEDSLRAHEAAKIEAYGSGKEQEK